MAISQRHLCHILTLRSNHGVQSLIKVKAATTSQVDITGSLSCLGILFVDIKRIFLDIVQRLRSITPPRTTMNPRAVLDPIAILDPRVVPTLRMILEPLATYVTFKVLHNRLIEVLSAFRSCRGAYISPVRRREWYAHTHRYVGVVSLKDGEGRRLSRTTLFGNPCPRKSY